MDWVKEVWAGSCTEDVMAYPQCCSGRQLANVKDVTMPCIDPDGVCVLWLQEEEGWKRVLEEHQESALPSAEAQLLGQAGHAAAAQEERQDTALHNAEAELPSQTGDVAAALEGRAPAAAEGDPACRHLLCCKFLARQAIVGIFKQKQGRYNRNSVAGGAMQTCFSCQCSGCQHLGSAWTLCFAGHRGPDRHDRSVLLCGARCDLAALAGGVVIGCCRRHCQHGARRRCLCLLSCTLDASCMPSACKASKLGAEAERLVRRDAGGQPAAEPAADAPTGDAPTAAAHVKVGLLQQARTDAHRRVTMQVRCTSQHTASSSSGNCCTTASLCITAVQVLHC